MNEDRTDNNNNKRPHLEGSICTHTLFIVNKVTVLLPSLFLSLFSGTPSPTDDAVSSDDGINTNTTLLRDESDQSSSSQSLDINNLL